MQPHDVLVSEALEVAELIVEFLMTTVNMCWRVVMEHLHSNVLPIFMYTLYKFCISHGSVVLCA